VFTYLLTQAPAQICLISFYISVTTLIRNTHAKNMHKIKCMMTFWDLIKDHSENEGVYTYMT